MESAQRLLRSMADPDTFRVFSRFADLVYTGGTYDETLESVCRLAPQLVSGCDHASLMMRRKDEFVTAAASDEVARIVDELELEVGDGPCVDAVTDEAWQLDGDLTQGCQWPELGRRVLDRTPVRGMAGFRLLIRDDKVGALNFFSDTPGALDDQAAAEATVMVAFASVTIAAAEQREQASTLRAGLESNREIGKAIGLLMAGHRVGADEAFGILKKASQDLNVKIAEVAREIVDYHDKR